MALRVWRALLTSHSFVRVCGVCQVGLPAVGYTSFFSLRAAKVYREILDEEEEERERNGDTK